MIARIYIWILLGTLLPYLWCFCHELRSCRLARRLLLWLPASVVIGYSGYLALQPNFVPDRPVLVDVWFVVMALFAVPVFVYALFSFVGWCVMKALKGRRNWGRSWSAAPMMNCWQRMAVMPNCGTCSRASSASASPSLPRRYLLLWWKRTTTASPSPTDRTASAAFARMQHKLFPAGETKECLVMVCPEADASGHLFVSAYIKNNRIRGNLS